MYIGLSPEQERLRSELRSYYEKLLTPEVRLGPRADDDRQHGGTDAHALRHGRAEALLPAADRLG